MILYLENPKDTTRKLLELINEYSKAAVYKINTQKPLAFLYTNNESIVSSFPIWIPFISFSSLISVARTSRTMLDNSGESGNLCLVPDLRGNTLFFTIDNNVCCRLIINSLYYVEVGYFHAQFLKIFNHK